MRSSIIIHNVVINWERIDTKESVDEFSVLGYSEAAEGEV